MKFLIAQRQLDAFHQDNVPMASLRVMYSVSYVSLRFVFEEALYVSFNTSCIAFPVIRTEHFRGKELVGSYVMRKSSQKSIWDAVGAAIIMTTNTKATCQSAYFTFCQFGTWSPIVVVEFDIPRYSSAHLLGHRHFLQWIIAVHSFWSLVDYYQWHALRWVSGCHKQYLSFHPCVVVSFVVVTDSKPVAT